MVEEKFIQNFAGESSLKVATWKTEKGDNINISRHLTVIDNGNWR
jgi:hypothetical protein